MKRMGRYLFEALLGLDRFGNALLGGRSDETISSRLGRWSARQDQGVRRRVGGLVCGAFDVVDPGHCAKSARSVPARAERRKISAYPYRGRVGDSTTKKNNSRLP